MISENEKEVIEHSKIMKTLINNRPSAPDKLQSRRHFPFPKNN